MEKQVVKKAKVVKEPILQTEVVEEAVEEAVEEVIEVSKPERAPHEDVEPEVIATKPKKLGKKTGTIVDCNALRLREGANIKTSILAVIPVNTKVEVDLDNSTESFYEVTYTGLIGFCVKQFVKLG